jgi:hypothetical protein
VERALLLNDAETGVFKGVAFVTFAAPDEAARACEALNGTKVGDGPLCLYYLLSLYTFRSVMALSAITFCHHYLAYMYRSVYVSVGGLS